MCNNNDEYQMQNENEQVLWKYFNTVSCLLIIINKHFIKIK